MQTSELDFYECGMVEIGFDSHGPTVAIAGVLHAKSSPCFIHSIEISIQHEKEKNPHIFSSYAYKPDFLIHSASESNWEMAHPFLINSNAAQKINVVLQNTQVGKHVNEILQNYYHQWNEVAKRIGERRSYKPTEIDSSSHDDLISEFKRLDICVNSYTELNHKCDWNQGNYQLELKINSHASDVILKKEFHIQLSKHDAKKLKTNCVSILDIPIATLLSKPTPIFETVKTEYLKPL